jgi:hypothetical protein
VRTTSADFDNFSEDDELWLSDLETRAIDLEQELSVWREVRQRALAEEDYDPEPIAAPPPESFRRAAGRADGAAQEGPRAPVHTAARRAASRSQPRATGRARADAERTRALLDHGRRTARRGRLGSRRKLVIGLGLVTVAAIGLVMFVLRPSASWPSSVAVVKNEITTACQNPNVVSEPNQVNFACDSATSQVLWVFSLMTSGDNPNFNDTKTGRQGLEPISGTQGGAVAWSLNLHHPYNPVNAVDSLEVAARAINNIIGGASLTGSDGKPSVQPGLESNPANCARYTGSAAVITRAGYPDICANQVTSPSGQAALVADVFQQWSVGASPTFAEDASVLFENANNPGNAQVQVVLRSLFGPAA